MSHVTVNGEPWGSLFPDNTYLPLHVPAGEAEINGHTIELSCTVHGEMVASNSETKKTFILSWHDFLALAAAVGINKTESET